MAFCVNCGTNNSEGNKFCPNCGTAVNPIQNENSKSKSTTDPILNAGPTAEVILWEGKPHGMTDRIKNAAHVNSTSYKITNQRIIIRTGLIGKKTEEIEMITVKDISVEQSLPDRLLGVGSITVLSSDETTPVIVLDDVKDVQEVKDIIRNAVRLEKAAHNISYREHM